jgi:hypothetical protein
MTFKVAFPFKGGQWCRGRVMDFGMEGSGFELVTLCFSVSLPKTLNPVCFS